jgi:hypothetical protein
LLKNKSELIKVSEELKVFKKKFDTLIKERDYFKNEESKIRQEFNKENLKINKDLVIKTVELKKSNDLSKQIMLKNKSLKIDKEVKGKEITNLSQIIEQVREKKVSFSLNKMKETGRSTDNQSTDKLKYRHVYYRWEILVEGNHVRAHHLNIELQKEQKNVSNKVEAILRGE